MSRDTQLASTSVSNTVPPCRGSERFVIRPTLCVCYGERKSDCEEDSEGHKCKDSWLNLDLFQPKAGHFISKSGTEAESVGTHQGERKTKEMIKRKVKKQAVLHSCLVYIASK